MMTAEQAREAAKGLTFETVWAALMESRQNFEEMKNQMRETNEETKKHIEQVNAEAKKHIDQVNAETQKQMQESQKRIDKTVSDLSRNIGGLNNSLGRLMESMFSVELWKKFDKYGYGFTKGSRQIFSVEDQPLAEVDFFLENGEYAMPVEIKTNLNQQHIDEHLERIDKIRRYLDEHGDHRKLLGAVAGGSASASVVKYAQKNGLFVILQNGDSVSIADVPPDFIAKIW